ncbi:MAG: hypothetical protein IAE95_04415 [Chitinophagaceae bacterium]|nr:hypothetical protein [Chitinophagaceae bacterium]
MSSNGFFRLKRSIVPYFLILLVTVVAYWQVALMQHSLIWDARDIFLPWRFFISDCLRNGVLPVWNPYQQSGYPFFADPQSGMWYPVAQLMALFGRYSVYLFNAEFILTVAAGGWGLYRLAGSFGLSRHAALFGGITFVACGFYVSNAEHLSWAISASCVVWLFWAYRMLLTTGRLGYALLGALFQFLVLSGGYPAFIIVSSYLLAAFFVSSLLAGNTQRAAVLRGNILFAVAFLVLAVPVIYAFSASMPYMTRGAGVTLQKANGSPFSPQSLLSLLTPFATLKNDEFYRTDISMRNAYMGLLGLAFLLVSVVLPGMRRWRGIAVASIVCLLISFGPALPLRAWLYHYVPLMDLFRFPSLFRLFFLIGAVLIASGAFHVLIATGRVYVGRVRLVVLALPVVTGALVGYSLYRNGGIGGNYHELFVNMGEFIRRSVFRQLIIVQGSVQLVLLLLILFLLWWQQGRYFTSRVVLGLAVADMVMATQFNMYGTVTDKERCADMQHAIAFAPTGFPLPDMAAGVNTRNDDAMRPRMKPLTANLNNFCKNIATDSYSPFILSRFDMLAESVVRDSAWGNPVLYLTYGAVPDSPGVVLPSRRHVAVDSKTFQRIPFSYDARDAVQLTSFRPGHITASVQVAHDALLVLQQVAFPGWHIEVDGRKVMHLTGNYCYPVIRIPAGSHTVVYRFAPRLLQVMLVWYVVALITLTVVLVAFRRRLF